MKYTIIKKYKSFELVQDVSSYKFIRHGYDHSPLVLEYTVPFNCGTGTASFMSPDSVDLRLGPRKGQYLSNIAL